MDSIILLVRVREKFFISRKITIAKNYHKVYNGDGFFKCNFSTFLLAQLQMKWYSLNWDFLTIGIITAPILFIVVLFPCSIEVFLFLVSLFDLFLSLICTDLNEYEIWERLKFYFRLTTGWRWIFVSLSLQPPLIVEPQLLLVAENVLVDIFSLGSTNLLPNSTGIIIKMANDIVWWISSKEKAFSDQNLGLGHLAG